MQKFIGGSFSNRTPKQNTYSQGGLMRKLRDLAVAICLTAILNAAYGAVTPVLGTGEVKSIRHCATDTSWRGVLLFKLSDGKWFGVYSTFFISGHTITSNPYYGSGTDVSLIMLAFSTKASVDVRASYYTSTHCGITATMMWDELGDYIHVGE